MLTVAGCPVRCNAPEVSPIEIWIGLADEEVTVVLHAACVHLQQFIVECPVVADVAVVVDHTAEADGLALFDVMIFRFHFEEEVCLPVDSSCGRETGEHSSNGASSKIQATQLSKHRKVQKESDHLSPDFGCTGSSGRAEAG